MSKKNSLTWKNSLEQYFRGTPGAADITLFAEIQFSFSPKCILKKTWEFCVIMKVLSRHTVATSSGIYRQQK